MGWAYMLCELATCDVQNPWYDAQNARNSLDMFRETRDDDDDEFRNALIIDMLCSECAQCARAHLKVS